MFLATILYMAAASDVNAGLPAYPIGFWNYAPIEVFDEAKVQEWKDAGMTLTMGPEFGATPENIGHMKQILDWAQARDIRVIICDPRTRARSPLPEDFSQQVAAAVADFGAHPATWGFHILDEPGKEQFEDTCRAVQIVKQAAPNLHPFVNLLPWHIGASSRVGYEDWGTYLDDFLAKSGAEFLCYDCYSQMNPGDSGWAMYFRNLNEYGAAARRAGVPFWNTILSVGHFHYRCPSEDDIRWQFNSTIAYGAQGVLYFFFYMRQPHDNYRLSPVDEFWDRTQTFESLKRANRGFTKRYGRLFLDLTFEKAMQWPEPIAGCLPFEPDAVVKEVSADGNRPIIVSRFRDSQDRPWVVVVNNSTAESCHARILLNGASTQVFGINWNGAEYALGAPHSDAVITQWLAPGQMEVFRIQENN